MSKKSNKDYMELSTEREVVKTVLLSKQPARVAIPALANKPVVLRFAKPIVKSNASVRAMIGALVFMLGACSAVKADSLYPGSSTAVKTSTTAINLFSDAKAHNVGDILTILIQETASATSSAATKNSKTETGSLGPGVGPILRQLGIFSLSGSQSMDASGSTTRNDNLNAEIAVTVKQVLPNGNLLVEGTRKVGMNKETQTITLTGVVRQQDISSSNTVPSPLVSDAQISYSGKGPVGDKQREGLITKLFKLVF
jgi:flagellar L-ring protein precursor FlgH